MQIGKMHSVDLVVELICGNLKVLTQKYLSSLMPLILTFWLLHRAVLSLLADLPVRIPVPF